MSDFYRKQLAKHSTLFRTEEEMLFNQSELSSKEEKPISKPKIDRSEVAKQSKIRWVRKKKIEDLGSEATLVAKPPPAERPKEPCSLGCKTGSGRTALGSEAVSDLSILQQNVEKDLQHNLKVLENEEENVEEVLELEEDLEENIEDLELEEEVIETKRKSVTIMDEEEVFYIPTKDKPEWYEFEMDEELEVDEDDTFGLNNGTFGLSPLDNEAISEISPLDNEALGCKTGSDLSILDADINPFFEVEETVEEVEAQPVKHRIKKPKWTPLSKTNPTRTESDRYKTYIYEVVMSLEDGLSWEDKVKILNRRKVYTVTGKKWSVQYLKSFMHKES